jgi:hypothetical protein
MPMVVLVERRLLRGEVPLHTGLSPILHGTVSPDTCSVAAHALQGYLDHKKPPLPRTLR